MRLRLSWIISMGDHSVQVLSPPSPCPLVGAASFTSLRTAAWPTRRTEGDDDHEEEIRGEGSCWEEVVTAVGLMGVQLAGAAYMVVLAPALELGLDPLFLVTLGSLANAVFTLPFSIKLERYIWPSELSGRLILQFLLLALGGVTGFQALMLAGMKKTSPAIAAAMPNLAPGFIFVVAAALRFERVDLACCYTRAKILGTTVCLAGAITMSILQSKAPAPPAADQGGWALGCFCLLGAVVVVSCTTVLQAATMVHFPVPITLCTVTSLLGALLTAAFQLLTQGGLTVGTHRVALRTVLELVLVGGGVSSACVAFQTWALKKKGPVVVSMFNPTQTVGSAIFSAIFLGRVVKPGSIAGMLLLFAGLYVVLWAKKKETQLQLHQLLLVVNNHDDDDLEAPENSKQPLLLSRPQPLD